jgi:hypothetical protein
VFAAEKPLQSLAGPLKDPEFRIALIPFGLRLAQSMAGEIPAARLSLQRFFISSSL